MRTYALWDRNRQILVFLMTMIAAAAVSGFYDLSRVVRGVEIVTDIRLFSSGCLVVFPNRADRISQVILIFTETLLVGLLVARRRGTWRSSSVLISTLYNDGILYFVFVLSFSIVTIVVFSVAPSNTRYLTLIPQAVFHSIVCNRLLLRLRGVNRPSPPHSIPLRRRNAAQPISIPMQPM